MKDLEERLKQCGKPTSDEGKAPVEKMNESHYPFYFKCQIKLDQLVI